MTLQLIASLLLSPASSSQTIELTVGDLKRSAVVYAPKDAQSQLTPVIFVFHGHGGRASQAAKSFAVQTLWPEAMVIYPQGVPTVGQLTDQEGKRTGWQAKAGDSGNRDFKFFDSLMTWAKEHAKVDTKRIYSMGHSNGGGFTYLIWSERPNVFAAIAPSGATSKGIVNAKPTPVFHIAGETDPLVKFAWQEQAIRQIKKLNTVSESGTKYGDFSTLYKGENGNDVVTYIHPGGHKYPSEAVTQIVQFFKTHPKK